MDEKFLRVIAENTPSDSEYEIVLRANDGEVVDSVKITGTSYAFGLFKDIKTVIELGEDIEIPVEDQPVEDNQILDPKETDALKLATDLVKDPKKRLMALTSPKSNLQKALGDMYNKVADKIKAIANTIK